MKRNVLDLETLQKAVRGNKEIELTVDGDTTIDGKELIIIKRDGHKESYKPIKMKRVVMWACDNNEHFADELLRDTEIKMYQEIKIVDLYDELIKTASNKISMLYPQWEYISAKLMLLKIYKETWGMKDKECYAPMCDVVKKGTSYHIYSKEIFETYSDEELERLTKSLKQERDYLFTFKGLNIFYDKNCLNYTKTKKLELPQHAYMRVAMALHHREEQNRIENVINTYDRISQHQFTFATPIMLNSGTPAQQLSSCVLSTVEDDTHSILDTVKNISVYSKFKGGTALDASRLRSRGSYIAGNQGMSSGPVPFLKILESGIKAFNQGGKRVGSCCVYFQWWHMDVEDMVILKSNGGTEENRARGLKYAVKLNQLFLDRLMKDEDVSLFDPKEVRDLFEVTGKEFNELYEQYESKAHVKRKTIKARDLWQKIMKERSETGNIYLFHEENVNDHNMLDRYIGSSNLCTEILEPSKASMTINEEAYTLENDSKIITKRYDAGEIALCNLASVNLVEYGKMSARDKGMLIAAMMKAMDNTIDIANYPVKEGMLSNKKYRYLGIGVNNYANYLASKKIVIDTQEALEETHKLFDELSYLIIEASCNLAIRRGRPPGFFETAWARGKVPLDFANKEALKLTKYQPDREKWKALAKKIKIHGMRNMLTMAIAPTATSGKAISATESIEPPLHMFYKEEGTINMPSLVPNFRQNNKYYKKAFECDQNKLIEAAAIRQIYLDQAQSVNLYVERPDSLLELTMLHMYGFKLGMKTFYYLKQQKGNEEEVCESCT